MSVPPDPIYVWLPTADDVAALLRARTKDATGRELGAWTDETRPTLTEVEDLILISAEYIVGVAGLPPDACTSAARGATTLRAAMMVELSYFPEQVRSDRSAYAELKDLYDASEIALTACITGGGGGEGGGADYTYHSLPIVPATLADSTSGWRHPEYPATWQNACRPPTPAEPALVDEPDQLKPVGEPEYPIIVGDPNQVDTGGA